MTNVPVTQNEDGAYSWPTQDGHRYEIAFGEDGLIVTDMGPADTTTTARQVDDDPL